MWSSLRFGVGHISTEPDLETADTGTNVDEAFDADQQGNDEFWHTTHLSSHDDSIGRWLRDEPVDAVTMDVLDPWHTIPIVAPHVAIDGRIVCYGMCDLSNYAPFHSLCGAMRVAVKQRLSQREAVDVRLIVLCMCNRCSPTFNSSTATFASRPRLE